MRCGSHKPADIECLRQTTRKIFERLYPDAGPPPNVDMQALRTRVHSPPQQGKQFGQPTDSSTTKQGFIKGLFLRAERLCSTPDLLKTEMERIYSELLNNSYPEKFIDRVNTRITNQAPLDVNNLHPLRTKDCRSDQKNTQSGMYPSGICLYKHAGEVANPPQRLNP